MHVDTGHNFPEVIEFRDRRVQELGARLIVASVQDAIDRGRDRRRARPTRLTQPPADAGAARSHRGAQLDAAIGGARRDEEKARAKERVFSFRDEFGQWDPRNQRPELWHIYNGMHVPRRTHARLSALELDRARHLALHRARGHRGPSIYFAHEREVFKRDGMLMAASPFLPLLPNEKPFRDVGALPHCGRYDLHRGA